MNTVKAIVPNFDRQIEVIMNEFDFDSVYRCMILMDWKYSVPGTVGDLELPTFEYLKKSARQYLDMVVSQYKLGQVLDGFGSGGFRAGINEYGELTLAFVIEDGHYVTAELGDRD